MIGRIVLPKTTSMSLNDRFSHLRQLREQTLQLQQQQQQQEQAVVPTGPVLRSRLSGASSSTHNQRLAAMMESRPTVRAALHGQKATKPGAAALALAAAAASPRTRQSVKQRLSVKARLGVVRSPVAGRSILARLGRVRPAVKRLQPARAATRLQTSPWGRGTVRGRGRGRGVTRAATAAAAAAAWSGPGAASWRGRGGLPGRAGARGRGRGRGRGGAAPKLSREELDRQLDDYMASTKGQLDAELDAYMKESAI